MYASRPTIFTLASLSLLGLVAVSPAQAQANLFVNGDFSQGNTGFQVGSAYTFITPPSSSTSPDRTEWEPTPAFIATPGLPLGTTQPAPGTCCW